METTFYLYIIKWVKMWRAVHRKVNLGYFATEEEAYEAYESAKNES